MHLSALSAGAVSSLTTEVSTRGENVSCGVISLLRELPTRTLLPHPPQNERAWSQCISFLFHFVFLRVETGMQALKAA